MRQSMSSFILENNLSPEYCVDNDFRKWYGYTYGLKVCEPARLKNEDAENIVVLITSVYPFRILEQLEALGISYYYSYLLFTELSLGKYDFYVHF